MILLECMVTIIMVCVVLMTIKSGYSLGARNNSGSQELLKRVHDRIDELETTVCGVEDCLDEMKDRLIAIDAIEEVITTFFNSKRKELNG